MLQAKRERRARTDNYHLLQQWYRIPEQRLYEGIRPVVLFGIPPTERAQETGLTARSLGRAADAFDTRGIISLFRPTKEQREDHHRSLPVAMRQLIVDLKAEYADFTDGEIAAISEKTTKHDHANSIISVGRSASNSGVIRVPFCPQNDGNGRRCLNHLGFWPNSASVCYTSFAHVGSQYSGKEVVHLMQSLWIMCSQCVTSRRAELRQGKMSGP